VISMFLRLLGCGRLEFLVGKDHVFPTPKVKALDDAGRLYFLPGPLVDLSVSDPVRRPRFELVEVDRLSLVAG